MTYSLEDGIAAVKAARKVVDSHVKKEKPSKIELPANFKEKGGVFVTLSTWPEKELRGCIGYPEPILPLEKALVDAAKSAATRDPRFSPVKPAELEKILVEVSLLTPPEPIKVKDPKDYLKEVQIGRDGLIVEMGPYRGLLLPQVPVEWKWDVEEFLCHTCMKAGLLADTWLEKGVTIFRFTGQVFDETEPHGKVVERPLTE